jgi:hypothetical protein
MGFDWFKDKITLGITGIKIDFHKVGCSFCRKSQNIIKMGRGVAKNAKIAEPSGCFCKKQEKTRLVSDYSINFIRHSHIRNFFNLYQIPPVKNVTHN